MLDEQVDEFQAANYESREQIVQDILESFESTWTHDIDFHEAAVTTVCTLFAL
jgi:metal-responsive CopG/Arc/MetJ family transcriptional regulator